MTLLAGQVDALRTLQTREVSGRLVAVRGLSLLVRDLPLPVGALVRVDVPGAIVRGEVVGFDDDDAIVMLLGGGEGVAPGARVVGDQAAPTVRVGSALLGRVIDGLGRPVDDAPLPVNMLPRRLHPAPTPALERRRIDAPLPTGVRVIDAMVTLGKGQRVGIFSGPGIGKSTLLGMIARNTAADVSVVALIGERGREVRDFLERILGDRGRDRSVVVVATSDESPLLRVRAAAVACAVAEQFRDQGADVMLIMDSVTRFAQAQRQIGLAAGEQPATKGYPPSVFALMPRILERAGAIRGGGSITGLYAVLVEGDDLAEPISDAARGILDGHVALSRRLAGRGHYPPIDLLDSVSRVADDVCDANHIAARRTVRRLLAAYADAEELIAIGAYAHGADAATDAAIAMKEKLEAFLRQDAQATPYPETCRRLVELGLEARALLDRKNGPRAAAR
jgi:FliI/YscN family ATPase